MERDAVNVLLVVLEGARVDHLSRAAGDRDTTPFLDQVAREGVRFPNAYTSAPGSLAAHASMLTGLSASLHGATEETRMLGPALRVMPEIFKAAGYRTAAFCPDPSISPQSGFGRGFDRFYTQRVGGRITGRAADYARRASDRVLGRGDGGARRTTHALRDWLNASRDPFFAFVHYREPVRPLRPPAPYDRLTMPATLSAAHARAVNHALDGQPRAVSSDEAAVLSALYDGALRYADLCLQEIADALAAQDRWDRTLFIVTASYGESLGETGSVSGAPNFRDATLHVPLILRCPGRIPAGFVIDEFAQPMDLLPTIATLTGCRLNAPVQGRALLTATGATPGPRAIIAEAFRSAIDAAPGGARAVRSKAIRTQREKLIWRSDESNAFYDLGRDPDEQHNLADVEPERADRLRRVLFDMLATSERWAAEHGMPLPEANRWPSVVPQSAAE